MHNTPLILQYPAFKEAALCWAHPKKIQFSFCAALKLNSLVKTPLLRIRTSNHLLKLVVVNLKNLFYIIKWMGLCPVQENVITFLLEASPGIGESGGWVRVLKANTRAPLQSTVRSRHLPNQKWSLTALTRCPLVQGERKALKTLENPHWGGQYLRLSGYMRWAELH